MRNHSNENEFDLHENGRAGETHFHINGFARRLVLTQAKGNSEMAYCNSLILLFFSHAFHCIGKFPFGQHLH